VTADSNDDFIKRLQELFHTGNIPNLFSTEQFSKQIQEFNTQTKTSWDQFLNVLQTAYIEKTIDTHSHGGPDYKTTKSSVITNVVIPSSKSFVQIF
jgi:hypothetical protein